MWDGRHQAHMCRAGSGRKVVGAGTANLAHASKMSQPRLDAARHGSPMLMAPRIDLTAGGGCLSVS